MRVPIVPSPLPSTELGLGPAPLVLAAVDGLNHELVYGLLVRHVHASRVFFATEFLPNLGATQRDLIPRIRC